MACSEYRGPGAVGEVLPAAGPGHTLRYLRVPAPRAPQGERGGLRGGIQPGRNIYFDWCRGRGLSGWIFLKILF